MDAASKDLDGPVGARTPAPGIAEGVRAFVKQMIELGERAEPMRRFLEPASVRAESPGRAVAVTVTIGGVLIAVDFGPGHEDMDEEALAALILGAYERALAEAERRQAEFPGEEA